MYWNLCILRILILNHFIVTHCFVLFDNVHVLSSPLIPSWNTWPPLLSMSFTKEDIRPHTPKFDKFQILILVVSIMWYPMYACHQRTLGSRDLTYHGYSSNLWHQRLPKVHGTLNFLEISLIISNIESLVGNQEKGYQYRDIGRLIIWPPKMTGWFGGQL